MFKPSVDRADKRCWSFPTPLESNRTELKGIPMTALLDYPAQKAQRNTFDRRVAAEIRDRLCGCPYGFVFNKITWRFHDGRLTLFGQVPSFYLKQMLQEQLRGLDHVEQIVNQVDVVNSCGLSSVRKKESPRVA
jgi:hypothetical protein